MLDLDNFLDSRAAEMAPGGILLAYFLSCQDLANPENQTNPECRHRYFAGHDFEISQSKETIRIVFLCF